MADYNDIHNLFTNDSHLKKYTHKRWVKIHPENQNYAENTVITYNCRNVQDKLVSFHDGYILLRVRIHRNDFDNNTRVAPKSSHAFIKQSIVRVNNSEIENLHNVFLITEMLNQLEFSHDYSRIAKQYFYSQDTSGDSANTNLGQSERKKLMPAPANNAFVVNVKIPLTYISSFLRSLDFPLLNQLIEFDITYRLLNAVLHPGAASTVQIQSSVLNLPIVELPRSENERLLKGFSSKSFKKSLQWYRFTTRSVDGLTADIEKSHEIEPTIDGVRKLFIIPRTDFNFSQTAVDLFTTIKLTKFNIVIDSEDFYLQDILNDEEAYELIAENLNMQGKDLNTGSLLDFRLWKTQNSFYVFDLSRQKVFELDPRKSQSIRFRGIPSADCSLMFFLAQEKETTFDFVSPMNTKTV